MGLMLEHNSFNYKLDCFILSRCIYRSSAKYNQCKIASEQNHLTVFRLITGEADGCIGIAHGHTPLRPGRALPVPDVSSHLRGNYTTESWENELAWNEGAVPSQSPELAASGRHFPWP